MGGGGYVEHNLDFLFRYNNYSIVFNVNRLSSINTPNTNLPLVKFNEKHIAGIFFNNASNGATVFQYNTRYLANFYTSDHWHCTANNDFPDNYSNTEQWSRYN